MDAWMECRTTSFELTSYLQRLNWNLILKRTMRCKSDALTDMERTIDAGTNLLKIGKNDSSVSHKNESLCRPVAVLLTEVKWTKSFPLWSDNGASGSRLTLGSQVCLMAQRACRYSPPKHLTKFVGIIWGDTRAALFESIHELEAVGKSM